MSNYYATKLARQKYILAAVDKQIKEDIKVIVTNPSIDEVVSGINNLNAIREYIVEDIEYLEKKAAEEKDEEES